ncbi:hypothetical protein OAG52_03300 [Verrucomicrobia bacterium]|nr:hypothetical protein [Verrucomicrobiota bacterium]
MISELLKSKITNRHSRMIMVAISHPPETGRSRTSNPKIMLTDNFKHFPEVIQYLERPLKLRIQTAKKSIRLAGERSRIFTFQEATG